MDEIRIHPAGDPFTAKPPATDEQRLAELEERYRHELMADEERQELHDEIKRLRRCEGR